MDNVLIALNFLGAAQGIFLALILFSKKTNVVPNRLLGTMMGLFALAMGTKVYEALALYNLYPHFVGITFPVTFLFGPTVYLYARMIVRGERHLRPVDAVHGLPFLATYLYMIPFFMLSGNQKALFMETLLTGSNVGVDVTIIMILKIASGILYAVWTLRLLQLHSKHIKDSFSAIEQINLRWLKVMILGSAGIWGLVVFLQIISFSGFINMEDTELFIGLAIAGFVYTAGYMGLRQPEIFHPELTPTPETFTQESYAPAQQSQEMQQEEPIESESRYRKSGLTEQKAEELMQTLLELMERERPYLNNKLTLQELAEMIPTTPHNLSEVINSQLKQNFFEFVNSYRVKEAQQRLIDEANSNLTILAIALDSGFNSKSTFNSIFKKHTAMTPSRFRESLKASQ